MSEPGFLDDSLFEGDPVRIRVMTAEHNGNTWPHRHAFYEFVYIDTGFTLHSHDGRTSVLTSGDLFAIRPNEAHSYTSSFHTQLYNILFCVEELAGLSGEVLALPGISRLESRPAIKSKAAESESDDSRPFPVLHVGLPERRELVLTLEKMKWERSTRAEGWQLSLKSLLISFLIFYSRLYKASENRDGRSENGYYGYIWRALEYIEHNYASDIDSRDVAAATGLSDDYIARQFKQALQMTPAEYIRRFRVAKSMELLKTTDMSTAEIASAVGFGDISLYSRVFKHATGVSPTVFKKGDK